MPNMNLVCPQFLNKIKKQKRLRARACATTDARRKITFFKIGEFHELHSDLIEPVFRKRELQITYNLAVLFKNVHSTLRTLSKKETKKYPSSKGAHHHKLPPRNVQPVIVPSKK